MVKLEGVVKSPLMKKAIDKKTKGIIRGVFR